MNINGLDNKLKFNILKAEGYDYEGNGTKVEGTIVISVGTFDLYNSFNIDDEIPSILDSNVYRSKDVFSFLESQGLSSEYDWNLLFNKDCREMIESSNVDNLIFGKFKIEYFKANNIITNSYQIIYEIDYVISSI